MSTEEILKPTPRKGWRECNCSGECFCPTCCSHGLPTCLCPPATYRKSFADQMRPYWDRVNAMIEKHDIDCEVVERTADGREHVVKVSNLIICGYLEIVARGITYRSVPQDHGISWVSWEPFEIVGHFSALTDPHATIKWVSHKGEVEEG